jgi:hypothetical protein
MGPKTRSSKEKTEWRICPESGRLYHSSDTAAHSAWLSSSASAPRYPCVHRKQFISPVFLSKDSKIDGLVTISESVKYISIFLPKAVLNPCQIGFASWVRVTCGRLEAVLRAFPHNIAGVNTALALRGSLLARAHAARLFTDEDSITVETFR